MKKIDLKKYPMPFKVSLVLLPVLLMVAFFWFYSDKEEIIREEILPEITVQDKKERFVSIIVPVVNEVYADLMEQYHEAEKSIQTGADNTELAALRREYKATSNEELLMALKPHPRSIALGQAAMESAWATSRFFTEANNVFGVWSFNKNEPRIAAGKKRGNKTIWLKKYPSVKASMQDYYLTLARGAAFSEFRKLKMETIDPYALVKKLDRYSEKGKEYGKELSAIIQFNEFNTYDTQDTTKL